MGARRCAPRSARRFTPRPAYRTATGTGRLRRLASSPCSNLPVPKDSSRRSGCGSTTTHPCLPARRLRRSTTFVRRQPGTGSSSFPGNDRPTKEDQMNPAQRSGKAVLAAAALVGLGVLAVAASAAVPSTVAANVKAYKAIPKFVTPGPPIDASKARGKKIFIIPESSSIPFINTIDQSIQSVAKLVGVKTVIYTNQAQPSQWAAGMNQGIAQKPDLIMLQGAPDPRVLQPQLAAAKKAGIPVLVTHFFEESDPLPPNVTALVRVQFNHAARLEADYPIVDTGGKANVLIVTSNEVPIAKGMLNAMKQEFAKCG